MFVTNTRPVNWYVIYKDLGGNTKRELMNAGATTDLTEVTDVSQILFDPYLRKVRSINDRLDRGIDEGSEARLVLSGATL